jgi:5-methyltetrahydrofolate--homocysteine methyltransferase
VKLKKANLEDSVADVNHRAVEIAKNASKGKAYVFGSIGPTGLISEPLGSVKFDFLYEVFSEQVRALVSAGVHALILETFIDIQEARIALLAARDNSDLPVFVTLTFNNDFRTDLSATSPEAAAGILEPMGAFGVGANCGLGPEQFRIIAQKMGIVAERNTVFQPNAGIPRIKNGKTVFDASPKEYASFAEQAAESGAGVIGGCCGSKPEHISAVSETVSRNQPRKMVKRNYFYLCTPRDFFRFDLSSGKFLAVGERINPAGRKDLQEDLTRREFELLLEEVSNQEEAGADILDVNVSIALENEADLLEAVLKRLSYSAQIPLSIDTADGEALRRALKMYPGRALVNSVPAKRKSLDEFLPLIRRFGQAFIGLAMSDKGIAKTRDEKIECALTIFDEAKRFGFEKFDILIDPVVLSAATASSKETLEAIEELSKEGFLTVCGLSNVSHGLPQRKVYNRAFAVLAVSRGLKGAILDPLDRDLLKLISASRFLTKLSTDLLGEDEVDKRTARAEVSADSPKDALYSSIIKGNREKAELSARELLSKMEPYEIVAEVFSPAMEEVGRLFEQKKLFLPHVLMAAEAVKAAFEVIKPELSKSGLPAGYARIVLATVEGDIHDIGKSIVGTVLSASGYEVYDLGVDVSVERIVNAVRELKPDIVGLSCLMTTTLPSLEKTVKILKREFRDVLVAVGGAVVTDRVKEAYGADIYARDAMGFVSILNARFKQ